MSHSHDTSAMDLLGDALVRVTNGSGEHATMTLPEVFVALERDDLRSFDGLQAHQRQPWHCLLAQLGALAVARGGLSGFGAGAAAWRAALLELSGGEASAWRLVVEDASKPAFMQPPIPEGSLKDAKYKDPYLTPDELDMLVTSKNHDVKGSKMTRPHRDQWLFALVTLQTMEGFMGRGNYGIARMNGGFASRPLTSSTPGLSWGTRWRRDVEVLLDARQDLLASALKYDANGHALLWLEPWDGGKESSLELSSCDPFFVEVCRRLRLTGEGDDLECWRGNTKAARLDMPKALGGITRDVWTPTTVEKSLTLGGSGFDYKMVHDLLLGGDYRRPPALRVDGLKGRVVFVGECLARGQGGTEGLHRRELPIPSSAVHLFGTPDTLSVLAKLSKERIEQATTARVKILYPALYKLLAAGGDSKPDASELARWNTGFEDAVDARFFPALWDAQGQDQEASRIAWQEELLDIARAQLEDAIHATPIPTASYYRVVSAADSMFRGCARNRFPEMFETTKEET